MHSAITGAISALKGPLHGGANTRLIRPRAEYIGPEYPQWFVGLEAR